MILRKWIDIRVTLHQLCMDQELKIYFKDFLAVKFTLGKYFNSSLLDWMLL